MVSSLVLALVLAGCGGTQQAADEPEASAPTEPLPDATSAPVPEDEQEPELVEPEYDYLAVSILKGAPQDTPEATFELYLRDAIAQQVRLQRERIDFRAAYQDPEILAQDLGGLITDIQLIEDRSVSSTETDTSVVYEVDIDIVMTFADNETDELRCNWAVNLEKADDLWYVIKPVELSPFVNCAT